MPSHSRSRVLAGSTIEPFRRFFDYELTRKDEMAFSFRAGTNWCHDFPKLARESGFHFNMHRRRVRVDWNRISSIDIDRVIGERDFSTIDDNVNNVVDYCLESEYDVKILDPNFVKLFRLAQLAVEYLLYCKQYLDHSVVILKEELKNRLEENAELKNELSASEKSVKELRDRLNKERSKGVEARLSDSHGEIHKCPQCPKTFVSAPFLTAHVNRRHPNVSHTTPNSPGHEQYRAETEKLHSEIKSLKERLNLTERVIRNESDKFLSSDSVLSNDNRDVRNNDKDHQLRINHRERDDIFEEQHRRYQEEIGHLKATLFDEIRSLKSADRYTHEKSDNDDCNNVSTKELIRGQENEIARLRQELATKRTSEAAQKAETRRDETREELWQSKISSLEARYRADIEALYNQLRVTQKSSDQMRLDYTTRLSDLERREASFETSLIRARGDEDRAWYGGPVTGDTTRLVVEPPRNSSILEPARPRRFSGHEERSRIETTNNEVNSSECESIADRPEASDDRDDESSDAIARSATSTGLARTISTRKHDEETSSKIHEDREMRNEAGGEKTVRENLRNGETKIRLVSNRRGEPREKSGNRLDESRERSLNSHDPREKSWNRQKGPREKSPNSQEPREKSWNRYETREKSRNLYDEPRTKSSNAHDPREKSWYRRDETREISNFHDPGQKSRHRHDESREKSAASHDPREKFSNHHVAREKSWTRRDEPREKSPTRDEPRDKTPTFRDGPREEMSIRDEPRGEPQNFRDEPRDKLSERGEPRGKTPNFREEPREKPPNFHDEPGGKSLNFRDEPREKSANFRDEPRGKSPNFREARERFAAKARVSRRPEDVDRTDIKRSTRHEVIPVARGRQSANLEKSRTFSSSEEESDSLLDSESVSESSQTDDENERNDRSHIEEKTRRYDKGAGENGLELLNSKLRELGVDPEWRGIPDATFAQILEIVRHHRNINTKKYRNFEDVRRRLIHELSRRLASREKEGKNDDTNERSQLGRLVTNVKSKVSKALTILEKNDGFYGTRPVSAAMNKSARRDNDESRKLPMHRSPAVKSRPIVTKEAKKSSNPRECPSSDHSYENETNATTNVNERYVDLPRKNVAKAPSTNELKQLSHSYESIKDFIKDTNPRQARSIFNVSGGLVASTPHKNAEITVGDSSANDKKETPRDSSPAIRTVKQRVDSVTHEASNLDSPRNNGRSVLKSAIGGSIANLAKKKVLFDLESPQRNARDVGPSMYPDDDERANDHAGDSSGSDFDISSIRDERDQANENKDDSAQASKVVLLKTSQSEKIAQISQQIEMQLSIARRKPAGAVEAMFLEKFSLPSEKKDSPVNVYPSFASPRSHRENPTATNQTIASSWQNSESRITNVANKRDNEITNLDMDIDELLRLE